MTRIPLIGSHEFEVEERNDGRVSLRVLFDADVMKSMGLSPLKSMGLTLTRDEAETMAAALLEAAGWRTTAALHDDPSERHMLTRRFTERAE